MVFFWISTTGTIVNLSMKCGWWINTTLAKTMYTMHTWLWHLSLKSLRKYTVNNWYLGFTLYNLVYILLYTFLVKSYTWGPLFAPLNGLWSILLGIWEKKSDSTPIHSPTFYNAESDELRSMHLRLWYQGWTLRGWMMDIYLADQRILVTALYFFGHMNQTHVLLRLQG